MCCEKSKVDGKFIYPEHVVPHRSSPEVDVEICVGVFNANETILGDIGSVEGRGRGRVGGPGGVHPAQFTDYGGGLDELAQPEDRMSKSIIANCLHIAILDY